ncbi:hypothetical protein V8F20_009413 [Naviculisporaceae sp. PSN 640]
MKWRRSYPSLSTVILLGIFTLQTLAQDDALQLRTTIWNPRDTVPFKIEWEWVGVNQEDTSVSILLKDFRFKSIVDYLDQELQDATSYTWTPDMETIMRSFRNLHPDIVDPGLFYLQFDCRIGASLANISSPDFQILRSNGSVFRFEETSPPPRTSASSTSSSTTSRTTVFLPTGPARTTPTSDPKIPNLSDAFNPVLEYNRKLSLGLGIGFGGLAFVLLLAGLGWFVWHRRRKAAREREMRIKQIQMGWDNSGSHFDGGKPELGGDGIPMGPMRAELGESLSGTKELEGTYSHSTSGYDGGRMHHMGRGAPGAFSELDGNSRPVEVPGAGLGRGPGIDARA